MPKQSTIGQIVDAAVSYADNLGDDTEVRAHYLYAIKQITEIVGLEDLTTAELMSLKALLIRPHGRVLTGRGLPDDPPTTGKILSIVPGGNPVAG